MDRERWMGRDGEMREKGGEGGGERGGTGENRQREGERQRGGGREEKRQRERGRRRDRGREGTARDIAEDADVYGGTSEEWECVTKTTTATGWAGRQAGRHTRRQTGTQVDWLRSK